MRNTIRLLAFYALFSAQLPAQTTLPPEMVFVQGGTFTMGCTEEQEPCEFWEVPTRTVRITSFEIGKYEVTQAQYELVMSHNPSVNIACGLNCPVDFVSLFDCVTFCNRLSVSEGLTPCYYFDGAFNHVFDSVLVDLPAPNTSAEPTIFVYWNPDANGYRLPTESEWEYAARGGKEPHGKKYMGSDNLEDVAWNEYNSNHTSHPVGLLLSCYPGTYDMCGNVDELVFDFFSGYGSLNNLVQCTTDNQMITWRGGSAQTSTRLKASWRYAFLSYYQSSRNFTTGFRLARNAN